jgi:phosphoglucomutase
LPSLPPGASPPRRLGALLARSEAFTTTGAFDADALVRLETRDHALLKKEYEALFCRSWFDRAPALAEAHGIRSYQILNYEGIRTLPGPANRNGREDGGWKAEFLDERGQPVAFIWMRGSRTEPIFRVMADVQGTKAFEQELLHWHREILSQADRKAMLGG